MGWHLNSSTKKHINLKKYFQSNPILKRDFGYTLEIKKGKEMDEQKTKKQPTIGCCGIDCGLCPRYYTQGPSKCPGCLGPNFIKIMGQTCSISTCCVKHQNKEACGECTDFPCTKFDTQWFGENAYDSFVTHKKALTNNQSIKTQGLNSFLNQQQKRIKILEELLKYYNDGRSKNFYCLATALLPISDLEKTIATIKNEIIKQKISNDDKKNLAKLVRTKIKEIAQKNQIELKLNKPPTWKK